MPEPATIAAVVAIACAGGAFRGFAGFGGGLLMAPLLTLVCPPTIAVPIVLMLNLAGSLRLLPEVREEVDLRRVLSVALPAIAGIPLGVYALGTLDAVLVERIVALVVLAMVLLLASGLRVPGAERLRVLIPAGWLGGLLTALAGAGGPPVVLTFLSIDEPPEQTRANLVAFFFVGELVSLITMAIGDVFTPEAAWLGLIGAPVFMLAAHFGARMFRRSHGQSYRRVALIFLALVAFVSLLWP